MLAKLAGDDVLGNKGSQFISQMRTIKKVTYKWLGEEREGFQSSVILSNIKQSNIFLIRCEF